MVQGITLKQGQGNVQTRAYQPAGDHGHQGFAIGFDKRQDPRDAEEPKASRILVQGRIHLRHTALTSFSVAGSADWIFAMSR